MQTIFWFAAFIELTWLLKHALLTRASSAASDAEDMDHLYHFACWESQVSCLWVWLQVGTQLPVDLFQQNYTSLFACTPSIECEPQYAHLADGIVAIYAVDPTSKTVGLCTGEKTISCPALPQYPQWTSTGSLYLVKM